MATKIIYTYDDFVKHLGEFKQDKLPINFLNNDALSYKHWKEINNSEKSELSKNINLTLNKLERHNIQRTYDSIISQLNDNTIKLFLTQFHKNIHCNNEANIINYIKLLILIRNSYTQPVDTYISSLLNDDDDKETLVKNVYIMCIISKSIKEIKNDITKLITKGFSEMNLSDDNNKKELYCEVLIKIFNTLKNNSKYKNEIKTITSNKKIKSRIKFLLMDYE